jgi:hypothetical protein
MKRYKLQKDLPTFKVGDEFYLDSDNNLCLKNTSVIVYNNFVLEEFPNILTDWFEEIPENKRWRAEYGGEYAYITDDGSIFFGNDRRGRADNYRYRTGNYARIEDSGSLVEYKEYSVARQVLLDDAEGGKFIPRKLNHYMFSGADGNWLFSWDYSYELGQIYFKDRESLRKSLEEHKEQWETVRKYEMGEIQ